MDTVQTRRGLATIVFGVSVLVLCLFFYLNSLSTHYVYNPLLALCAGALALIVCGFGAVLDLTRRGFGAHNFLELATSALLILSVVASSDSYGMYYCALVIAGVVLVVVGAQLLTSKSTEDRSIE